MESIIMVAKSGEEGTKSTNEPDTAVKGIKKEPNKPTRLWGGQQGMVKERGKKLENALDPQEESVDEPECIKTQRRELQAMDNHRKAGSDVLGNARNTL